MFRFAYVDFASPDQKVIAITLSERDFQGRKLLIKDGELRLVIGSISILNTTY
jgi:hypothetical protein